MPYLIIPSRRTRQPQGAVRVNQSNLLARGLFWVPVYKGRPFFDIASGATIADVSGNVTQGVTSSGLAAVFGGSSRLESSVAAMAYPLTMMSLFSVNTVGSPQTLINWSNTSFDDTYLQFGINSDGTIRVVSRSTVPGYVASNSTNTVTAGKVHCACGVWSSASSRIAYLDGIAGAEETSSCSPASCTTLSAGAINRFGAPLTDPLSGRIVLAGVWNRALSSTEIRALTDNPWQIFAPDPRRLYFDGGASGDTYSLTATGLAGGTPALDAPALTQNHGVTASNIAGTAPTLGSPALNQNHALTANNLAGTAPTLGSPALTLAGTLVANDITGAAPVLASAVLTQNHALTATAIGGTAATLGTPAMTQNNVVTAANLTGAAPVLGTPTVVLGGTLLADNILGATPTLGSPTLTQNHALTASPLLGAAPILGSPAFGQNHLLTGSNIVGTAPQLGQPDLTSGAGGGTGATVEEIVDAMMAALNATTIPVDVQKVNAVDLAGVGSDGDPWRAA